MPEICEYFYLDMKKSNSIFLSPIKSKYTSENVPKVGILTWFSRSRNNRQGKIVIEDQSIITQDAIHLYENEKHLYR